MNILFLSDIHFGRERKAHGEFSKRAMVQDSLLNCLKDLPQNMKIHYVVVTGDIAWTGSSDEYSEALIFFKELLKILGLNGTHISFCAGNHDVNRRTKISVSESEIITDGNINVARVDELYGYDNMPVFADQIYEYNEFCYQLGVIPYTYPISDKAAEEEPYQGKIRNSYTIGTKDVKFGGHTYRFVGLNTAVLSSFSGVRDDNMFLGLPQIKTLIEQNKLKKTSESPTYTIALFHHAERYLNSNEQNSYSCERTATLPFLLNHVNLALCGHTENGADPIPLHQENGGTMINGGAAYYSDDHSNSFSILHCNEETKSCEHVAFRWSNRLDKWVTPCDLDEILWELSGDNVMPDGRAFAPEDKWILKLSADSDEKTFQIRSVSGSLVAINDNTQLIYDNFDDMNRSFDLRIEVLSNSIYIQRVRGREWSVRSIAEYIELTGFIGRSCQDGRKMIQLSLISPHGESVDIVFSTDQFQDISEDDKKLLYLLKQLQKIEDEYRLSFTLPAVIDVNTQVMCESLVNIMEDGGGVLCSANGQSAAYFCDQRSVFEGIRAHLQSGKENLFHLQYTAPVTAHVLGADINLGSCLVIVVNLAIADEKIAVEQAASFMNGDTRRIVFNTIQQGMQTVIIPIDKIDMEAPQYILKELAARSFGIHIPPQDFRFGGDSAAVFIDKKTAAKHNIVLKDGLKVF